MGLTIEQLHLVPEVEEKARELKRAVPGVVFTSGRRTLAEQAHAMAANIIASGSRNWIVRTYAGSIAITLLQSWVTRHPGATTEEEIAAGLLSVLEQLSLVQQNHVSRHLSGRALDIEPGTCTVAEIEKYMKPLKVLTHEGGLARLHVEC